jgi:hypothetical protein
LWYLDSKLFDSPISTGFCTFGMLLAQGEEGVKAMIPQMASLEAGQV